MRKLVLALFLVGGCKDMATYSVVHDLLSGFPAAPSGVASFYSPGTLTPIVIYGDSSGTAISNPVSLDSNGAAAVWLNQLARMIVQTAGGITVSDNVINQEGDTSVANTSTAFSATTLKGALDTALQKFGGQDFQYVPSGTWVGMSPRAWFNSEARNVLAYGSVGATTVNDGVTPADSALDAAIADAGSGTVYLPAGNYLLNAAHSLTASGITIVGAGSGATTLTNNTGSASVFSASSLTSLTFRGLTITATGTPTGNGIAATSVTNLVLDDVTVKKHDVCLSLTTVSNVLVTGNSYLLANQAHAGARAIKATAVSGMVIVGGNYGGDEYDIELLTTTAFVSMFGASSLGSGAFVRFDAAISGSGYFTFNGNNATAAAMFSFGAATLPKKFSQSGNGVSGYKGTLLSGATFTPDLTSGDNITIDCTTTGSATTVAVPTPAPLTTDYERYITITYWAHAGGALTAGSVFAAGYHLSAQPTLTDTHKTTYRLHWDPDNSVWREVSRSDTT